MKILLVFPYYPPDTGVSTFRAVSFFEALSKDHVVRVLKPGKKNDLDSNQTVSTLNETYIKAVATAVFRRKRIEVLLSDYLKQFDCIIVSVPIFSLCVVALIGKQIGIPVILDIRDHPDLVYYTMTNGKNKLHKIVRWLIWKWTEALLTSAVKKTDAVLCVGQRSLEYQKRKTPLADQKFYNVHNGFNELDLRVIETVQPPVKASLNGAISIGIAGSIHRFRDSSSLRALLHRLDEIARSVPVRLEHWGILSDELLEYQATLKHLVYNKHGMIARQEYLRQILLCDMVILVCSESLIWEPTTTVFDYLLLGKPILFVGNKSNEAYRILMECNAVVLEVNDLSERSIRDKQCLTWKPDRELVLRYSRENQNKELVRIIDTNIRSLKKQKISHRKADTKHSG